MAQPFVSINHGLPNVAFGSLAMGDFDNDGDLDAAIVGSLSTTQKVGGVYLNNGSGFFQLGPSLPAVSPGLVCWADYDRDGDLDLLVSGRIGPNDATTDVLQLLRNDNGALNDSGIFLPTFAANAAAFSDFDNDGDIDLFLGGAADGTVTYYLKRENNEFVPSGLALPGLHRGATISPADWDADGDMDLLMAPARFNQPGMGEFGAVVMSSKGDGTFENFRLTIDADPGITAVWHDFDLNGRLDVATLGNGKTTISLFDSVFGYWRGSQHASIQEAHTTVGDYDRDGRPDILVMGILSRTLFTSLGKNAGGDVYGIQLNYQNVGLTGLWLGDVAFADLSGDGNLDILQTGVDADGKHTTKLYRNGAGSFAGPTMPDQLSEVVTASNATLSWQGAAGATTFNVRIGTTPGGGNIVTPLADAATGRRRVVALGNASQARSFLIQNLAPGTYYWSVQSIDPAFNGSAFAPERQFTIGGTLELRLSVRLDAASNKLILSLTGIAGRNVVTERSDDFSNWQTFGSTLAADQEVSVDRPAESVVYFRARVIP
jgi:hypothetical protein